jgi:hypothetical protein
LETIYQNPTALPILVQIGSTNPDESFRYYAIVHLGRIVSSQLPSFSSVELNFLSTSCLQLLRAEASDRNLAYTMKICADIAEFLRERGGFPEFVQVLIELLAIEEHIPVSFVGWSALIESQCFTKEMLEPFVDGLAGAVVGVLKHSEKFYRLRALHLLLSLLNGGGLPELFLSYPGMLEAMQTEVRVAVYESDAEETCHAFGVLAFCEIEIEEAEQIWPFFYGFVKSVIGNGDVSPLVRLNTLVFLIAFFDDYPELFEEDIDDILTAILDALYILSTSESGNDTLAPEFFRTIAIPKIMWRLSIKKWSSIR